MIDKRLWREIKKSDFLLTLNIAMGLAIGILAVLQASYLAKIVNKVFLGGQGLSGVWPLLLIVLGMIILRAVLTWFSEQAATKIAGQIKQDLRQRLLDRLFLLGPVSIKQEQTGELVNLLTEGIEAIEVYFSRYLPQLVMAALIPVIFLGFIFPLDLITGLILLCTAPLIPLFMILIGKWAENISQKQWGVLSRMSAHFQDVLQGLTTLKLLGRSKRQGEIIALVSNRFRETTLEVLRIAFLSALTLELLTTLSTALVAVGLGVRLIYGKIGFEEAFFLLLLAPEFYLPLRLLGTQFHASLSAINAAKRIFEIFDQPVIKKELEEKKTLLATSPLQISLQNVAYTYHEGSQPALEDVSFTLNPGEKVALVGPSGSGKSTIANLLLGFLEPDDGQILVNNIPLDQIELEEWRHHVALVAQTPYLFTGTIAENIGMGRPEAQFSDIVQAAQKAGAHQFIIELPQGYDTPVGEEGIGLSGGQAQTLAIARAFLKNAPFIILDEATAGLDPEWEELIENALGKLLQGRTVLIIAHRLSTIYKSDQILVLEKGKVVEVGQHTDLYQNQGLYYQLVTAFGGEL